jgi:hypothetical protein
VASGFEIGDAMKFPAARIEKDFAWAADHPVVDAYRAYMKMPYDRQTWDLTAVLYALRSGGGYFDLSAPGRITADDAGRTTFRPEVGGKHRYLVLTEAQRARTLECMVGLASQPAK